MTGAPSGDLGPTRPLRLDGVYAVVDTAASGTSSLDWELVVRGALDGGVAALQLRDKDGAPGQTLERLRRCVTLAAPHRVPVFANDRPDLALLAGAAGVHLGQDDVSPQLARRLGIGWIGRSTHDEDQVLRALSEPIDYLAIGPVAHTKNKARLDPVLGLRETVRLAHLARARRPHLPIVAIGGIDASLAASLAGHVDAVAVIGALLRATPEPRLRSEPSTPSDTTVEAVSARARSLGLALATGRAGA